MLDFFQLFERGWTTKKTKIVYMIREKNYFTVKSEPSLGKELRKLIVRKKKLYYKIVKKNSSLKLNVLIMM